MSNNGAETKTNQRQIDSQLKRNGHTMLLFFIRRTMRNALKIEDIKALSLRSSGIKSMTWLGCVGWRFGFDTYVGTSISKPKQINSEELLKQSPFV